MSTPTRIIDTGNGSAAKVTARGELVVAPIDYSIAANQFLDLVDTPYSMIVPKANKRIVITGFLLAGNKNISATTDAIVSVYKASSATTLVSQGEIIPFNLPRSGQIIVTGIFLNIEPGFFVNARINDDDAYLTILYYRV